MNGDVAHAGNRDARRKRTPPPMGITIVGEASRKNR